MKSKQQVIDELSEGTGLSKTQISSVLYVLDALITSELARGEPIKLPGIGTFEPRETGPRTARNPRTGAEVDVPAKTRVVFTPSATLKNHLNP